jgi:hypothetical protein
VCHFTHSDPIHQGLFKKLDRNEDSTLNRREIMLGLRKGDISSEAAATIGMPSKVLQEGLDKGATR